MNQYCIKQQTIYTGETKNVIVDENGLYFAGYDFMGSVDWEEDVMDAYYMDIEEARMIVKDLVAADEPEEPEKIVINTDDLMKSLKTFLENIGCTNVTIGKLDEKQIAELRAKAHEI